MDLSWLVCDAKHFAQMKKDLLAEETSNTEDPDLIAIVTPEEQLFIFEYGDKRASLFARYKERRYLSLNRKVLFCEVEERPRMSEVSFWENGVNVWGAYHYGDEDIYHLEENGKPPGNYYVIKETLLQMQREQDSNGDEEVDHVYSLPLFQAKDLTGYGADTEMPQGKVYKWDCRPRPNAAMRFLNRLLRRH